MNWDDWPPVTKAHSGILKPLFLIPQYRGSIMVTPTGQKFLRSCRAIFLINIGYLTAGFLKLGIVNCWRCQFQIQFHRLPLFCRCQKAGPTN